MCCKQQLGAGQTESGDIFITAPTGGDRIPKRGVNYDADFYLETGQICPPEPDEIVNNTNYTGNIVDIDGDNNSGDDSGDEKEDSSESGADSESESSDSSDVSAYSSDGSNFDFKIGVKNKKSKGKLSSKDIRKTKRKN